MPTKKYYWLQACFVHGLNPVFTFSGRDKSVNLSLSTVKDTRGMGVIGAMTFIYPKARGYPVNGSLPSLKLILFLSMNPEQPQKLNSVVIQLSDFSLVRLVCNLSCPV